MKNEKIYDLLNLTQKPMKKYKEIQKTYPNYILLTQIGCFYKAFDNQSIFLSEKTGLNLAVFNPKTKAERIMCGFHIRNKEKYKNIIIQNKINCIFLKQFKDKNGEIYREIDEILEFNNFKILTYDKKKILEIKKNYY